MTDDLISRQASIDAVEHITSSMSVCVNKDECHGMKRMQRQAVIELANLPSAQQWIPVSERLPEIGEHYVSEPCIVYCSNGAYGFAELEENLFGQVGWNCERDDEYHEPLGEVLAWMPLPEPWRGEEG